MNSTEKMLLKSGFENYFENKIKNKELTKYDRLKPMLNQNNKNKKRKS